MTRHVRTRWLRARSLGLSLFFLATVMSNQAFAAPITLDDFEDGTTENWFAGGGPVGQFPPVSPTNVATGGPGGAGDNFLLITSRGGGGPGSRLVATNATQWAGDYLASGVTAIEMDVNNLGTSDLLLRLLFEDPIPGPPSNVAISLSAVSLLAGGGWTHVVFPILPADLFAVQGDVSEALRRATVLRLFHGPLTAFPGDPVAGLLGVDNITANAALAATAVPEPVSLWLFGSGLAVLAARKRRVRA